MESSQSADVNVLGGKVNVGPQVFVDGDIERIHDSRTLICCNCSKKVWQLIMLYICLICLPSRPRDPDVVSQSVMMT